VAAIRSAFWLVFGLLDQPEHQAQARGWLARVRRLLDEQPQPLVEEGFWLAAHAFFLAAVDHDADAAQQAFVKAAQVGARFKAPSVSALARHGQGRVLIAMGRTAEALAIFDEVMVSVTCGEVVPMVAGVVYCSVISACYDVFDVRRAHEWTAALSRFCAAEPDMVPFHGQCLIRRSELLQMRGAWRDALAEAERAAERLTTPTDHRDRGLAFYQLGELYRLRGDFEKARDAYRRASLAGCRPDPGFACLRAAEGQPDAAAASIRRALQEVRSQRARVHLLRAGVDILLEASDPDAAAEAAEELGRLAARLDAPFPRAAAAQTAGTVALARGNADEAVRLLRLAWATWRELDAPYEVARVRTLMGNAFRMLGDEDGARLEFDAAYEGFEALGAAPDLARLAAMTAETPPTRSGGLTGREVAVLRLVATGKSNRMIATELEISEKTVARHLSNIFTKLDLPSRSAATAYAYEHKLV
jgi:ATP/maltotriose-dependent transcriptional regulator MalT